MKIIEQIKDKVSLEEYIQQKTQAPFKRVGIWYSLPECPFCSGHDCARFNPNSKTFYCFQCFTFCGDAIAFRKHFERISFKEALEKFVEELGIKKYDKKEIDWIFLKETACDYLTDRLFTSDTKYQFRGKVVTPLQYLTDIRQHSIEAIFNFRIGFNDGKLVEFLETKYPKDIVKASGLGIIPDGCFTYPVLVNNQITYFRIKDPNKIKKFQMPISTRSRSAVLYNQGTLTEGGEIWVVEGEDDAVTLWDCGVVAVATCGGLTMEQIDFIKSKNLSVVYSAFDDDSAGKKNTETLTRNLSMDNLFIVNIVGGKDIDEVIRNFEGEKTDLINELKKNSSAPSPEMKTSIVQKSDGYYIEKGEDRHWVRLTNWTIMIKAIVYSDIEETAQWNCELITEKTEKEILIPVSAFSHTHNLREYLLNQGKILYFRGTDYDLNELINYFSVVMKPKNVIELNCVGDTKFGFISENVFVSTTDELKPLTNGYLAIDDKRSVHIVPLIKRGGSTSEMPNFSLTEPVGGIHNFKKYVYDLLVKNRNYKPILAVGWTKATLWSSMFYERRRFFPLLVLHGKFQSGKSVTANWLMSMIGMRSYNPEMLSDRGTSEVGLGRKMAYYSSLPVFIEDYRNDETGQRFHTFLRGCYDRTSATKGLKDDFGVRRVIIRSCVLMTGEHAPADAALFSRCVPIELTRSERKDKFFKEIMKLEPQFSSIGLEWIKCRNKGFVQFYDNFERLEVILNKELGDPRQSSCFAVAVAGAVGECPVKEDDLIDFSIRVSKSEFEESKREEYISRLWECVDILYSKHITDENEVIFDSTSGEVAICLHTLMAKVRNHQWTKSYEFPSNRELAKLLKQEDYLLAFKQFKRDGRVSWRWVFDLTKAPPTLKDVFYYETDNQNAQSSEDL